MTLHMKVVDICKLLCKLAVPIDSDISNFRVDFAGENRYPQISFDLNYFDDSPKVPDDHELAKEFNFKEVF